LLRDFLGYEEPESSLYGRAVYEVIVERFSKEESREFLMRGFREEGVSPPPEVIDEAVNFFDGIVGWLVLFGRRYVDGFRDVGIVKNMAVELAVEELSKLSPRERMVLRAVASGCRTWSQVRRFITEKYGLTIPNATLTRLINKLEKLSIIKNYDFQDPVYREAAKKIT
jgi:AAA+ ATPase superfamily predicted ATPase